MAASRAGQNGNLKRYQSWNSSRSNTCSRAFSCCNSGGFSKCRLRSLNSCVTADVKKQDLQHQEAWQQQHRQYLLVIEQHLQDTQQQLQQDLQAQHETSDKQQQEEQLHPSEQQQQQHQEQQQQPQQLKEGQRQLSAQLQPSTQLQQQPLMQQQQLQINDVHWLQDTSEQSNITDNLDDVKLCSTEELPEVFQM